MLLFERRSDTEENLRQMTIIPKTYFKVQAWGGQVLGSNIVDAKGMPSLLRRRISPMGQEALALASSLPLLDQARYVFSSRHGEFSRTLSILKRIAEQEALSPADFSLSVHHALISLLSIVQKNHKGHTAIAGGAESFGAGLIEAIGCLAENPEEPVLLLHCDDLLPEEYSVFNEAEDKPMVFALLLTGGEGPEYSFEVQPEKGGTAHVSLACSFLTFIQGDEQQASVQMPDHLWLWERYGDC